MAQKSRIVVGMDPGLANVGLGAVSQSGKQFSLITSTLIRTTSKMPLGERLETIYHDTYAFLADSKPEALSVEGQYFHQQRQVSFKVGQAMGVCLLAATQLNIEVFEYGPTQVKQALVGTGRADKSQVTFMVRALLGLTSSPKSHHVADALGLALTHLSTLRFKENST
jgi:crossover junction endodeoxyribonuclease RuvC